MKGLEFLKRRKKDDKKKDKGRKMESVWLFLGGTEAEVFLEIFEAINRGHKENVRRNMMNLLLKPNGKD